MILKLTKDVSIHKKVVEFHRVYHASSQYHHTNELLVTETG
jgi:hypothetical protein